MKKAGGAGAALAPARAFGLAAALVALLVAPATVAAAPPDPSANIAFGPVPNACYSAPTGAACETASVGRLDAARAMLRLGPYRLPRDFLSLIPARQWLVLANLDRIAYSLPPIRGLSPTLDAVAKQGAQAREDPNPWPLLSALHGQLRIGFSSNWAGGQPNGLIAYYGWMYDDGYGSGNIDCSSPSAAGCWGHRHDILAFTAGGTLSMGAAAPAGRASYALTIVETSTPVWRYSYTWAQAKAVGAAGAFA